MTMYGWDIVPGRVAMPMPGGTIYSTPFTVPRTALVMVLYVPELVGTASTIKLQTLIPARSDQEPEVWQDVSAFNLGVGAPVPMSGIPENAATSLPVTATGAGVLRCVASVDQSIAPSEIAISFLTL